MFKTSFKIRASLERDARKRVTEVGGGAVDEERRVFLDGERRRVVRDRLGELATYRDRTFKSEGTHLVPES